MAIRQASLTINVTSIKIFNHRFPVLISILINASVIRLLSLFNLDFNGHFQSICPASQAAVQINNCGKLLPLDGSEIKLAL